VERVFDHRKKRKRKKKDPEMKNRARGIPKSKTGIVCVEKDVGGRLSEDVYKEKGRIETLRQQRY